MKQRRILHVGSLAVLTAAAGLGADAVPGWLTQAAAQPVPQLSSTASFVVLFAEEAVTVEAGGRRVMRERQAVKVLQPQARITAYRTYDTKSGRIRDFQGWLIPAGGQATQLPKNRVADVALSLDYVYDEARAKSLDPGTLMPGTVFGWEIVEEEKTVFTQDIYAFQGRSSALLSRYTLTVPAGWEVDGVLFNLSEPLEPVVTGNTYTWELRHLPRIEAEDYGPPLSSLAPWLAVNFFPPSGNPSGLQGLRDWAAVSSWLTPLVDPQAEVTPKIAAKALELTANAASELDKIRAIAAFAQQTNYVAVLLNVTRGGGYTPHYAEEVLTRNYGDCKDKATLMRALLKAAGIRAYLVTVTAGDPRYVRPDWASPMQFNHAIVAVSVSEAVDLPAVIDGTPLGRLLIFDPTDSITPVGDLPEDEQGSHALVLAGAQGTLIQLPLLPPEASRIESRVEAAVNLQGRLEAAMERRYFGQSGAVVRGIERFSGASELRKRFERNLALTIPATTVSRMGSETDDAGNTVAVNLSVTADGFAQVMQGRLLIVRPGLLASGGEYFLPSTERKGPILLSSDLRRDSIRVKLPAGFEVDELPAPVELESDYGVLRASWVVENGEIVMQETLEIHEALAPASDYAKVREFFEAVGGAHGAPVVLVRR